MPDHWTYASHADTADLQQGDILRDCAALRANPEVGRGLQSHQASTALVVVTQTCDLVRRSGAACNATDLTVCPVVPLGSLLPELLQKECGLLAPRVFDRRRRSKAAQLLQRIINQNEQSLGLFYFHPDEDLAHEGTQIISEPCVGQLRRPATISASAYDCMLQFRCGRLTAEFQSKLGWLIGNLFSRVATVAWSEVPGGKKAEKDLVSEVIEGTHSESVPVWSSAAAVASAIAAGIDLETLAEGELDKTLQGHEPPRFRDALLDRVSKVVSTYLQSPTLSISEETSDDDRAAFAQKIVHRLTNDPQISELIRQVQKQAGDV